jgi:sulfoxide reductase heme-binding subunit YedZ
MNQLPLVWITTRAAGIAAFLLLTASMVAGLVLKTRPFGKRVRGVSAMELHRSLTIAALAALAIHGVALVADSTIEIGWMDLVVPGTLPYRPLWTGLGVAAGELMFVIALSYRFRRRLTVPVWRKLHYAAYLAFGAAVAHGIFAGSGTDLPWMRAMYITSLAAVAGAAAFRIVSPAPPRTELPGRPSRPMPEQAPTAPIPAAAPAAPPKLRPATSHVASSRRSA